MDEIHRKRLEWMANAKRDEIFPRELFDTDERGNGWDRAVSATAKAALDEIDRLTKELAATEARVGDER